MLFEHFCVYSLMKMASLKQLLSNLLNKLLHKDNCTKMGICLMLAVKNCNFIFFGKILIMFGFLALSNISSLCSTFPHFASPFFLILLFLASLKHVLLRSIMSRFAQSCLASLNHFSFWSTISRFAQPFLASLNLYWNISFSLFGRLSCFAQNWESYR